MKDGSAWGAGRQVSSQETSSTDSPTRQQTAGLVFERFSSRHMMGALLPPHSGRRWVSEEGQAEERAVGGGPSFGEYG